MNKWIFGAAMFCIMLNFASLIISLAIPGITASGALGIPSYKPGMTTGLESFANTTASAESPMTDKGNLIYRVLDMINIGFIQAFKIVVGTGGFLYSFPALMISIIGPLMGENPDLLNAINLAIYTLFTIGYGLFIFGLWSGRDVRED